MEQQELKLHEGTTETALTVPMNEVFKARLKALAAKEKRSVSWIMRELAGQALLGQGRAAGGVGV